MEDPLGLPQRAPTGRRRKNHEAEEHLVATLQSALPGHRTPPTAEQQRFHVAAPDVPEHKHVQQGAAGAGTASDSGHEPSCSYEWGPRLEDAFAGSALAMFNYMTPLSGVQAKQSWSMTAEGHDLESLLFAFLDELLFQFHTDGLVCCRIHVDSLAEDGSTIAATCWGEPFNLGRHEQGTEIKAITYSAMQIYHPGEKRDDPGGNAHVYVIVDI